MRRYPRGVDIIQEDQAESELYIIQEGDVEVWKDTDEQIGCGAHPQKMAVLEYGGFATGVLVENARPEYAQAYGKVIREEMGKQVDKEK